MHSLKCWPTYFQPIRRGDKPFDLRKDDRNYQVDDRVFLREYDPVKEEYTGKGAEFIISYVLRDFPGLEKGYCILGYKKNPY